MFMSESEPASPDLEFCGFRVSYPTEHSKKSMGHYIECAAELAQKAMYLNLDGLLVNPDKAKLDAKLKQFKLPVAKKIRLHTQEFLADPSAQLAKISSPNYSLRLTNKRNLARNTKFFNKKDKVDFASLVSNYDIVRVTESYQPLLSGTIATNGIALYMEAALGYVGRVIHDGEFDFMVERDNFSPFFHYKVHHSITDINQNIYRAGDCPPEPICRALYNVINYISEGGSGVNLSPRPGYYEFGIADITGDKQYRPIFWDWTVDKAYNYHGQ
jgi:hypothetical protein